MKKLPVINLFGGPGCGKSTTAASVFSKLKILGYNVELVTEFAKDMVWEKHDNIFTNQLMIFANQHHRLHRLMGQVDAVITDSPILLGLVYNENIPCSNSAWEALVMSCFDQFKNINYMLTRQKVFNPLGRRHSLEEAMDIDQNIYNTFNKAAIAYTPLGGNETASYQIVHDFLATYAHLLKPEKPLEITDSCHICNGNTMQIEGNYWFVTIDDCKSYKCKNGQVYCGDEYSNAYQACNFCMGTGKWLCTNCNDFQRSK